MNVYAALVERHFPWKAELFGNKPALMSCFPPQISHVTAQD
jgi:hypothetical protein